MIPGIGPFTKLVLNTVGPTKQERATIDDIPGAIEVGQKEFAITRPGDGRSPYLETFGIRGCVVLVLYDHKTNTGGMAHLDSNTSPDSFKNILDNFKRNGVKIENLSARLIGGKNKDLGLPKELIQQIRGFLADNHIPIIEEDLFGDDKKAIILDTRTGKIFDYQEKIATRPRKDWEDVLYFANRPGPLWYYFLGNGLK